MNENAVIVQDAEIVPMEVQRDLLPIGKESDNLLLWIDILAEAPYYKKIGKPGMLAMVLTGRELGVGTMASLNGGFWDIQGRISMAAEMMRAKFRTAGHSLVIVTLTPEMCTLKGTRRDNGDVCEMTFTMEDAIKAGVTNKNNWKTGPKDMLMASCTRKVIRFLAPELLAGTGISDDDFDPVSIEEEPKKLDPEVKKFIDDYDLIDPESVASKFIDAACANLTQSRDITIKQCSKDRKGFEIGLQKFKDKISKRTVEVETKPV